MEPLRPKIDRQILGFIRSSVFTPDDFLLSRNGVCRLNPQLAGLTVKLAMSNDTVPGVLLRATQLKGMIY
jgi:hypothetical protein